jgi:hypothetical protein
MKSTSLQRKKTKALKKTLAHNPLYKAAWRACREPWVMGWGDGAPATPKRALVTTDLRAALNKLLKSGWSMQALEAFAYSWSDGRHDHVTRAPWRWAVYWALGELKNGPLGTQISKRYLDAFNAEQRGVDDPTA